MFWTNPNVPEPLRQNRWYISIPSVGSRENFRCFLKESQKPSYTISTTEHTLLTHKFRYPGLLTWNPIEIKFISGMIQNESGKKEAYESLLDSVFERFLLRMGYAFPTSEGSPQEFADHKIRAGGHSQLKRYATKAPETKQQSVLFSNNVEIVQINGSGETLEAWRLYNCYISSVNYGNLSYESEQFVEISVKLEYDAAELILDAFKSSTEVRPKLPDFKKPPATATAENKKPVKVFEERLKKIKDAQRDAKEKPNDREKKIQTIIEKIGNATPKEDKNKAIKTAKDVLKHFDDELPWRIWR